MTVFKTLKERREEIVQAWKDNGYLEGLKGKINPNIALLLESSPRQIIRDSEKE